MAKLLIEDVARIVNVNVEQIFHEAMKEAMVLNGDISPEDNDILDHAKMSLANTIMMVVNKNVPDPIGVGSIYTRNMNFMNEVLEEVNSAGLPREFFNVSYKNDVCDSIAADKNGKSIAVYLPNSFITDIDRELFSYFAISLSDHHDLEEVFGYSVQTIQITSIKELIGILRVLMNSKEFNK